MSSLEIQENALAKDLENGISQTDAWFSEMPKRYMLRTSVCGLVSAGISHRLNELDWAHDIMIARPGLTDDTSAEHVYILAENYPDDPIVIDATYSQFFGVVGLSYPYAARVHEDVFPAEKVLAFQLSERQLVQNWMATVATLFQIRNKRPKNDYGNDLGRGDLMFASRADLAEEYGKIWNPARAEPWQPPDNVLDAGKVVAEQIRPNSIKIKGNGRGERT
jgi:hypothetical protein